MFRTKLDLELKLKDKRGSPFLNLRDTIFIIFEKQLEGSKVYIARFAYEATKALLTDLLRLILFTCMGSLRYTLHQNKTVQLNCLVYYVACLRFSFKKYWQSLFKNEQFSIRPAQTMIMVLFRPIYDRPVCQFFTLNCSEYWEKRTEMRSTLNCKYFIGNAP